tara:strand:+ start:18393 stop:18878 length:486 start_codon:yes stop_codon:yes gene_type:complete
MEDEHKPDSQESPQPVEGTAGPDWIERNSGRFSSRPDQPALGSGKLSEGEDRTWGMFCHLAALSNLIGPSILNIVGPLIPWLLKRQESPWVDAHGKESINFQLTMSILAWIGALAMPITCGVSVALSVAAGIFSIVMAVVASVRANEGKFMPYPFSFRFFR